MLNKILNISKWIAGVIGGVTAVAGIVMFIYAQGIKGEQNRSKSTSIENKVDRLIVNDSLKNGKLDLVLENQEAFSVRQVVIEKKLDRLNESYINHLKSDQKIDELLRYLESTQEQLKKNGSYLYPTVFGSSNTLIR